MRSIGGVCDVVRIADLRDAGIFDPVSFVRFELGIIAGKNPRFLLHLKSVAVVGEGQRQVAVPVEPFDPQQQNVLVPEAAGGSVEDGIAFVGDVVGSQNRIVLMSHEGNARCHHSSHPFRETLED